MAASDLEIAAEHLPVAIWMGRAPGGEVVYTNAAFREVLGLDAPPDAQRGGFVEPYGVHKPDGSPYPEAEMPFERCIAARATVVLEDLVIHRRDGRKVSLRVFAKPIFDADGKITHVLEAFTDITREVEAVGAQLEGERQLARARRLESIGALVAGIAHDFNNLLAVTKLVTAQLLGGEGDERRRALLGDIAAVTDSGIALIRNLLGFARRSKDVLAEVDLGPVVSAVVELASHTFDRRIEVRAEIAADPAERWVRADRAQLEQVAMNLLINARDALVEGGGAITVRLSARTLEAGAVDGCPAGRYVVLEVVDTGTGIDPAIRDFVWEPYFTTKTAGSTRGTGLGLSTVHGIVRGHAAFVELADNAPRGTIVRVAFPRAEPPASPVEPAARVSTERRRPEGLVLLVDDERLVRQATSRSLEILGYRVLQAEHGAEALRLFDTHKRELRAVVLDLVMPGLPAAEVVRALERERPELPILLITGSTIDEAVRAAVGPHVRVWIPKPFSPERLAEELCRAGA